jgi:hypothetical protein
VQPISKLRGRVRDDPPLIEAHSGPISDLETYPFDNNLFVTAALDGHWKLWKIPEYVTQDNIPLRDTITDPLLDIEGTNSII